MVEKTKFLFKVHPALAPAWQRAEHMGHPALLAQVSPQRTVPQVQQPGLNQPSCEMPP